MFIAAQFTKAKGRNSPNVPQCLVKKMKKPDRKDHILHDSIYIKQPEQANPLRQNTDGWSPGMGKQETIA